MIAKFVAWLRLVINRHRFLRFLISGGINTTTTYAIYLLLLHVLDYRIAYTVAYVAGIILSYAINWLFVFRVHRGWSSVLLFPFIYLAQYLVSLVIIWAWVDVMGLPKALAPLLAIVITIPVTYCLSRFVFVKQARR